MSTAHKSVCCQEINKTKELIATLALAVNCILDHPGDGPICSDGFWIRPTRNNGHKQGGHCLGGVVFLCIHSINIYFHIVDATSGKYGDAGDFFEDECEWCFQP